jgi:DNA-3-methyladenine glycosylase II
VEAPDAHLHRADPVLARLIDEGGPLPLERDSRGRPDDLYGALVRTIAGQQLSVKAARAIYGRLTARFDGRTPTPEEILADDPDELRVAAGFSRAKTAYLRSLAEHVVNGELELDRLAELSDEEVLRELTAVKGIGEWSAHMFLMFTLHRPDVLAVGDLGIRNAVRAAYGLAALPKPAELEQLAEPWRPYRTRACLYLWRSLDNEPAV